MSTMPDRPSSLSVLSLNCWGLKYISKYPKERLAEIGARIAAHDPPPDIVGLQECWTQEGYESIRRQTKHILPYGKFYYGGIFGAGLAILSRWPIEESSMRGYPLSGRPTAFFRGDWYVGKGVASAKIRFGPGPKDVAEVFCTHFHAFYAGDPADSYICHRTAQAWELAKMMRGATERGHLVICVGDFNMLPLSLAHRVITGHAPVEDAWRVIHPDSSASPFSNLAEEILRKQTRSDSVEYNMSRNGMASNSILNTWHRNNRKLSNSKTAEEIIADANEPDKDAQRLDYIFVGNGYTGDGEWLVENVRVGMTERHPTLNCSLSDHFSVEATLSWQGPPSQQSKADDAASQAASSGQQVKIADKKPFPDPFAVETYDEILCMISIYRQREYRQRRLRLGHFVTAVVVSIGCFVAVWWSPHNYVAFILMVVSSLGLAAGVIDGLIGGLFVGSELRCLKEFEWEIENAKRIAAGTAERESLKDFMEHE
ncbi:MAG: hypothetical protein M1819_002430 [Sarea resinae]|nr:MAG: hypothetical protein M1819_002430 [Sarea resinae]